MITPIINIKIYLPSVLRTIKLLLMALYCYGIVVNNSLSVKVICALLYILLCHVDIVVNWSVKDDERKDV